jgi:DNA primase
MQDILSIAEGILGTAVRVEEHRGWGIFWCPFHNDAGREGAGGQPNFGVNLQSGYWKCLRCGASGGSLRSLQDKLGRGYLPPVSEPRPTRPKRPPTRVPLLDEAVSEARACVQSSPAWAYLRQRGVTPYTALVYGLGYGIPVPRVHREIVEAAKQSMMVRRDGTWLWAGGVVYADPPTQPAVMNVRYIPDEQLPKGTRNFKPAKNHKSWGNRLQPLGSWRITPNTRTLIVLEGLFDMLITAQKIHELGRDADTVAVYTNGASPSAKMLAWFREHNQYEYVLLCDPDNAGDEWAGHLTDAIQKGGASVQVLRPPDTLDPDEAILGGWWPSIL